MQHTQINEIYITAVPHTTGMSVSHELEDAVPLHNTIISLR